jgi:hypothetical protein
LYKNPLLCPIVNSILPAVTAAKALDQFHFGNGRVTGGLLPVKRVLIIGRCRLDAYNEQSWVFHAWIWLTPALFLTTTLLQLPG